MKFSAQEEYGLRCLLTIGRSYGKAVTIPEIARLEGLSEHNVAKMLRALRIGGILDSERGHTGGYKLTKHPDEIIIGDVMNVLGGRLYDESFCAAHPGKNGICTNSSDCSIRSLWRIIQEAIDNSIGSLTLSDLLNSEDDIFGLVNFDLPDASSATAD